MRLSTRTVSLRPWPWWLWRHLWDVVVFFTPFEWRLELSVERGVFVSVSLGPLEITWFTHQ